MAPAVLYVDDDSPNLDLFRRWFDESLNVLTAPSGPAAMELLEREEVGVLISDQRMQPMDGIELLAQAQTRWPLVSRMLLTAYSDRDLLLSAIQRGHVHDYVLKPWNPEDLGLRLRQAMESYLRRRDLARAKDERDLLRQDLERQQAFGTLVGLGGDLGSLLPAIERIAKTEATVMIRGESGTGKELLAREIHRRSARAQAPFVGTNCAALSEGLLESELFGHEKGAFTGAQATRQGRFEQADGGTLFLDEIGDITPAVQVRLLRVLQERELQRVGGNRTIKVDLRVIAATHRNLEQRVKDGQFREDLFYRLNVVPLQVPPLRARPRDIEPLANHFLTHFGAEQGKKLSLSSAAIEALRGYDWPGNVRELKNVIERAVVMADGEAVLEPEDLIFDILPPASGASPSKGGSVFEEIAQAEADRIKDALRQAGGSKARAARLLGIPRTTLNDRLRKLQIQ
jgi:DNA-binding NtrC family response regulator